MVPRPRNAPWRARDGGCEEFEHLRDGEVREVEALRRRVAELESGAPHRVLDALRRLRPGREG